MSLTLLIKIITFVETSFLTIKVVFLQSKLQYYWDNIFVLGEIPGRDFWKVTEHILWNKVGEQHSL